MSYYLEPWQMEGPEAIEEVINGQRVAWTVDDEVYVHTGNTSERDDGYEYIGDLGWEDSPCASHDEDMAYNMERLREFYWENLCAGKLGLRDPHEFHMLSCATRKTGKEEDCNCMDWGKE